MNLGVSVVICCHNSAKRLPETLTHLAAQQVPADIPWEIVVVDNASMDETATVAVQSWPATALCPMRVAFEPQPGLRHARIRGIQEARHEVISFIDDDNWVADDWISRVQSIFAENPEVGACGGRSDAVTAISPPAWFENIKGYYATGSQHTRNGDITNTHGTLLWGAGLNLRTAILRKLIEDRFVFILSGREGSRLMAGEDTELCFAIRAMGWRLWYDDTLTLQHFVPGERLRWDYALRLMHGMGKASILFDLYLAALGCPPFDEYPAWKRTWLFQLLKTLRQGGSAALLHPGACFFQPEGASAALRFELIKGRLAMLWEIRGNYQKLTDLIARSTWAQPKGKRIEATHRPVA